MTGEVPGNERWRVLVLAGSRAGEEDPLARHAGVVHKALVPVGGVPMLLRVVRVLLAHERIGRIALSIERPEVVSTVPELADLLASGRIEVIPAAESPSLSVLAGFEQLGTPLLVTTADHALLTGAMLDAFLDGAGAGDIVAGLVPESVIRAAYPETKRTYLKFRDGNYSGANLFALSAPGAVGAVRFWRRVERDRKRPWRIAKAFGPLFLLRYLLGRLTLDETLRAAGRIMQVRAGAVPLPFAEAAIDVDKPADLVLVERIVGHAAAPSVAMAGEGR